jgi:hypothetical protein
MIEIPYNIEAPPIYLGDYRGWKISISKARGDEDTLSLKASNGIVSFDRAFGQYVPCGSPFIAPSEEELKKELDGMKKTLDNYEFSKIIKSSWDPKKYIENWNNQKS